MNDFFRRGATVALLTMAIAVPSFGDRPTEQTIHLDEARTELASIKSLALQVHDPRLRRALYVRVQRAGTAIDRADLAGRDDRRGRGRWDEWGERSDRGHHAGGGARDRTLVYEDALRIVQVEDFDSGRIAAIERVAVRGRFTTDEARGIAAECDFESTRRQALVALYPSVTDPWRYDTALDILSFPSSRRSVQETLGM